MPTLGQAVSGLEEQLFLGRERELATFREWLSEAPARPEILNVHGPGGIGKSALLSAFGRLAEAAGRRVVDLDARGLAVADRDGLLAALGGGSLEMVLARLNERPPVLLVDTFEQLGDLDGYFRDKLLARLDGATRVVIAGRQPLSRVWERQDVWHKLVRPLPLKGLPRGEALNYLKRRGLGSQPALMDQILIATQGHVLGLSLAADLALRLELSSLDAAPEWRLVVRTLAARLDETADLAVREILESAAVVREFDEATLLAIGGATVQQGAFARLCGLSVVQPTANGLALHDDVRQILEDDLRWRDPERHRDLRRRATDYYRERSSRATPTERGRLACDRLFLSDDRALRKVLFGLDGASTVRLESPRAADRPAIRAAWARWDHRRDADRAAADTLLEYPDTRLRIARDGHQRMVGFSVRVPVSQASLPVLHQHAALGRMLGAYLCFAPRSLPKTSDASNILCHTHLADAAAPAPTTTALLRDCLETLSQGGIHLAYSPLPDHQTAFQTLGFEPLPDLAEGASGSRSGPNGFVLDLTGSGVERWIDALTLGRRPPRSMTASAVERELHAALTRWRDDAWLGRSALWEVGVVADGAPEQSPTELRARLGTILARAIADADADARPALRALELAYLTPRVSHEAAAARLAVSRATLYRLLKRGIRHLALTLVPG
jgi:hypothetical protein